MKSEHKPGFIFRQWSLNIPLRSFVDPEWDDIQQAEREAIAHIKQEKSDRLQEEGWT